MKGVFTSQKQHYCGNKSEYQDTFELFKDNQA